MINTALSSRCCGPNRRFLCRSTMEHVYGILLEHVCGILLDEKLQVRARRFREHEVVRGVAGAPSFWTRSFSICGAQVCSRGHQASIATATTQDTLVKTHSLFRICVVVLSSITSRSVAAAAASSLMRFSPCPSCRGDAANPGLESAFITHFGCVSRHLFVCFPQSIVIACVSRRVSSLLVYFRRVSSLLVFPCSCASGAARACSFCTHQRTRITVTSVFKQNTSQRSTAAAALPAAGAARPHGQLCVRSFKTHLLDLFLSLCADGARQVRMACAKPQTSREVDQYPEGGLTRQCNARPSFLITCCV